MNRDIFDLPQAPTSLPEFLTRLVALFDDMNLLVLALLAYIAHTVTTTYFGPFPWRSAAKYITGPIALLYGLHLTTMTDFYYDAGAAFQTIIRTSLASTIVHGCFSLPLTFALHAVTRATQKEWDRLQGSSKELSEWYKEHTKERTPQPPPLEPIPRELSLRRTAEQARLDFEFECEIIRSAGLEEDEQETALTEARQKYLRKLQTAMQ